MAELFGAVGMGWNDGGAVELAVDREGDVHHDHACIFSMFVVAVALSLRQPAHQRNRKKRCAWLMVFAMHI